jgi:hypothetical protein
MATGHIRLGLPGALRDYQLVDPKRRVKSLANPMAAKLGEGSGDYNDFQNWAGWLMEDWQAGLGKKDPAAGGFLYATAETRFPNRLMLSPIPISLDHNYDPNYLYQVGLYYPNDTFSCGATASAKKFSQKFTARTATQHFASIYLKNEGLAVKVEVYSNSGGAPDTAVAVNVGGDLSETFTTDNDIGSHSYAVRAGYGLTPGGTYHLVISPANTDDTLTIPVYAPGVAGLLHAYVLGVWAGVNTAFMLMAVLGDDTDGSGIYKIAKLGTSVYALSYAGILYRLSVLGVWFEVSLIVFDDILRLGDALYLPSSDSGLLYTYTDAAGVTSTGVVVAANWLLASYNGFLWRAEGPDVYYSGDAVTWTGPISVAETGEQIVNMAGQGDYLYVSTESALYYIGFGDQVRSVTPWPSVTIENGLAMLNHQGSLFISLGRSLLRFDSGTMLPVGPDLGEGLPALREGVISALCSTNYWLLAAVNPATLSSGPQIWAWNSQGWHHVCSLPNVGTTGSIFRISSMIYDRASQTLYIAADDAINAIFGVLLPDTANYSSTTTQRYSPFSWLETDWFFGGLKEIYKDCESVYVAGDNIDSNNYVEVYWRDDGSTAWELLGTCTATRQELRWSDYATRPNTRQIKLGLALYSKTAGSTPIVRAVRLKYMAMVQDRYRWSLPIAVSDLQQMVDGKENPYTSVQMRAHLETLITRVPPCIFQDVDGVQYEVKILSASEQIERYELIDGAARLQTVYSLQVEQATTGTYTG